jgi:Spy/CpxP family protein refolding chaperone
MHRRFSDRIARELDLTRDQREQFEAMLPRHEAAFDSLRTEMDSRLRTLLDSSAAEVERILTPEQKTKWEGIRRRFHDRTGPPPPR